MKRLLVLVSVFVACKGETKANEKTPDGSGAPVVAPTKDSPESKAAFARITEFVKDGYGAWLRDNPTRECPHSIADLTQYMSNKDENDPWGHPYWLLCDTTMTSALAVRVASRGPDGKFFTADDPVGTYKPSSTSPLPAPAPTPKPAIRDVAVKATAADLVKDYKSDDITADDKYRNRVLQVTGSLTAVGTDTLGMADPPAMMFTTASGDVQARMREPVPKMTRGQKVTLRCTGEGFQAETALLADCVLE